MDQGSKNGLFKDEPWTDLTIANLKLQGPFRRASNSGQFYAILTNLRKPTDHRVPFAVVENRTTTNGIIAMKSVYFCGLRAT